MSFQHNVSSSKREYQVNKENDAPGDIHMESPVKPSLTQADQNLSINTSPCSIGPSQFSLIGNAALANQDFYNSSRKASVIIKDFPSKNGDGDKIILSPVSSSHVDYDAPMSTPTTMKRKTAPFSPLKERHGNCAIDNKKCIISGEHCSDNFMEATNDYIDNTVLLSGSRTLSCLNFQADKAKNSVAMAMNDNCMENFTSMPLSSAVSSDTNSVPTVAQSDITVACKLTTATSEGLQRPTFSSPIYKQAVFTSPQEVVVKVISPIPGNKVDNLTDTAATGNSHAGTMRNGENLVNESETAMDGNEMQTASTTKAEDAVCDSAESDVVSIYLNFVLYYI
jgi:hypothetical protein